MDSGRVESLLIELAGEVAFPPTPDMVEGVAARLPTAPAVRRPGLVFRIAAITAALLVVLVAALPGPRRAVADLLGLGGVVISILPELPSVPAASDFSGREASLADAQASVDFALLVPEGRSPDVVFLDESVAGGLVTMAYEGSDGDVALVITQMAGETDMGVLEKAVGPEGSIQAVTVDGDPAFWVEGPHILFVIDPSGEIREDQARLVGNTLLLVRDGVTVRVESGLGLDGALSILESLVPISG